MNFRFRITVVFLLLVSFCPACLAAAFQKPRVAVVVSDASFKRDWETVQRSSHGFTGVAALAGLPYDTLFIPDLASAKDLSRYRAIVFAQCFSVEDKVYGDFTAALRNYLAGGGNVLLDGPLAVQDENGKDRDHAALDKLLGIQYGGVQGDATYRIRVASADHFVSSPYEDRQFVTQPLLKGLHILSFAAEGKILLVTTDGKQAYPFLSVRGGAKNRTVLFSDASGPGVESEFRNDPPPMFYANRMYDALVRSLQWAVYGDVDTPFPAPQFSNARMAAMVRLDADLNDNAGYEIQTFTFLNQMARDTGMVGVYAFVSALATKAGWANFAKLGKEWEQLGGQIGTHTKNHRSNPSMTEEQWAVQLDGGNEEIETNMKAQDADIGKVEWFVNPGNTIPMSSYEVLARRYQLGMSHGLSYYWPVAGGNLTWYTGANKNFVLLDDVCCPDYQWFYDPDWSYTIGQIASYQESIVDHLFYGIGRGTIYNQMWHDYGISSMEVTDRRRVKEGPMRIKNTNMMPFYEAVKAKFATLPIYFPEPPEATNKVRALAQWDYNWKSTANQVEMELDLSGVRAPEIAGYTGGMGIRIENTGQKIQSVTVNGHPNPAFTDDVVILPNLEKGVNRIVIALGPQHSTVPRLTYVSKLTPSIRQQGADVQVDVVSKTKARFAFFANEPAVLLNADYQEWDRKQDHQLEGYVTSDRSLVLKKAGRSGFGIVKSTVPVTGFEEKASSVTLSLEGKGQSERLLRYRAAKAPKGIMLGGQKVEAVQNGADYELSLPAFEGAARLTISF